MLRRIWVLAFVGLGVFASLAGLSGCAGGAGLSAKQQEAVELRRYCERNPEDTQRCLGFLGDH